MQELHAAAAGPEPRLTALAQRLEALVERLEARLDRLADEQPTSANASPAATAAGDAPTWRMPFLSDELHERRDLFAMPRFEIDPP